VTKAEYIWMDGTQPAKRLRSKSRRTDAGTSKTVGRVPTIDPYVVTRLLMETVCDEGPESKAE